MLMLMTSLSYANDIYVTQSGASLDLDITQDGSNNTVGNSTTASASTGATTILNIDQIGNSNVIKYPKDVSEQDILNKIKDLNKDISKLQLEALAIDLLRKIF